MSYYYVKEVFKDPTMYCLLRKIQEYHDETGEPIYFSVRLKFPFCCPQESQFLNNMKTYLKTHHLELVKKYLPVATYKTAQKTHIRHQYYQTKLESVFIENAIQQIQEYDPFYLTMDDIHEGDSMLTNLEFKNIYYKEKMTP
jgi:hypothetical protein